VLFCNVFADAVAAIEALVALNLELGLVSFCRASLFLFTVNFLVKHLL